MDDEQFMILNRLALAWSEHPELSFGRLIFQILDSELGYHTWVEDLRYISDSEVLKALRTFRREVTQQESTTE